MPGTQVGLGGVGGELLLASWVQPVPHNLSRSPGPSTEGRPRDAAGPAPGDGFPNNRVFLPVCHWDGLGGLLLGNTSPTSLIDESICIFHLARATSQHVQPLPGGWRVLHQHCCPQQGPGTHCSSPVSLGHLKITHSLAPLSCSRND